MKQKIYRPEYLNNAIETYYQYNPDTLMPILMLSLASQGKLEISSEVREGYIVFASIDIEEVVNYEWVKLNDRLKKRLKGEVGRGVHNLYSVGKIPNELESIYGIFHQYDTITVVQEYHHRKGILVQHSSSASSEKAQRQYATIFLTEEFLAAPTQWLQSNFLGIANNLLEKSGIQPKRPRINVAKTICALLDYDGEGIIYNPFAGCAIAAAMIGAGENLYADGDRNDKLLAVAKLLCYGSGQRGFNIEQRDSTKWLKGVKAGYVLSTFLGYIDGKSAFDLCLSHCLEEFKEAGKFAGIATPKNIFEEQSPEMKEALNRDWVDSIVLLPFGETAVLIDSAKPEQRRKQVRFYNLTHPMLCRRPVKYVIGNDEYADILKLSDVKKKGYLKSLVIPEIDQQEGCEIISLCDLFERVPRRTWALSKVPINKRILASINRNATYDEWEFPYPQGFDRSIIADLFAPAYKLDQECLIVNSRGELEPRIFDAEQGCAYFQDGFAFKKKNSFEDIDYTWLVHELTKAYVQRQLHPYGVDKMMPEAFTEEQVLSLKINRPVEDIGMDIEDENDSVNADNGKLPFGQALKGEKTVYTIHQFLGHGYFGYTYSALAHNDATGEEKEVVLKEFYPWDFYHRDGVKAILDDPDNIQFATVNIEKFIEEARIMHRLGMTPDSHIVPAFEYFHSDDTDTYYYVMPFYKDGSLEDLQDSGFTFSEDMLIQHIVIPMCKALHIAHRNKVLHLDIKPENILVDEQGDAILTDFGVAKQYDCDGLVINREGFHGRSPEFAAPEVRHVSDEGTMIRFAPQPDIYSLAATVYRLATEGDAHPITFNSDQDEDLRLELGMEGYSSKFIDAIIAGLQDSAGSRPSSAQAFLKLFPGCEEIKL